MNLELTLQLYELSASKVVHNNYCFALYMGGSNGLRIGLFIRVYGLKNETQRYKTPKIIKHTIKLPSTSTTWGACSLSTNVCDTFVGKNKQKELMFKHPHRLENIMLALI